MFALARVSRAGRSPSHSGSCHCSPRLLSDAPGLCSSAAMIQLSTFRSGSSLHSTLPSADCKVVVKARRCKVRLGCCLSRRTRRSRRPVRELALQLYEDKESTFSRLIDGFLECTRQSREEDPQVVMRSIRQFVTGMKHYLREGAAHKLFQGKRGGSGAEDDAEEVLQELVVGPLQEHCRRLLEAQLAGSGSTARLADNMAVVRTRTPQELGAGDHVFAPAPPALDAISRLLARLPAETLPTAKLRRLVACVHALLIEVTFCSGRHCGAMSGDDLLPMLVMLVAHSGMAAAELEAEYMWGLLDRPTLFSEGGYYLTTFSCALQAIKNLPSLSLS